MASLSDFREPAVLGEVEEQRRRRAVEDTVEEVAHDRADDLLPRAAPAGSVGAIDPRLLQVALLLQNLHHRHHRRVGDVAVLAQRLVDVADGRLLEPPDDLHDGQFLRGERGMGLPHVY